MQRQSIGQWGVRVPGGWLRAGIRFADGTAQALATAATAGRIDAVREAWQLYGPPERAVR